MKSLQLKQVRYFLKLSQHLNFSDAARDLRISQPSLTKGIRQLEEYLGETLIRREGKVTHLTPFGRAMLLHFRELDEAALRAETKAAHLAGGAQATLRIGLMCTIGPRQIAPFLSVYRDANPGVEVLLEDLHRSELSDVLMSGRVDVALVGAEVSAEQRFRYIHLYQERMAVACTADHPITSQQSATLDQVLAHPYIDRLMCEFRDTFLSEASRRSFEPKIIVRSDREDWAQYLVARGFGIALMPEKSTVVSGLTLVPMNEPILERQVSLAVPLGREDTGPVQALIAEAKRFDWSLAT